MDDCPADLHPVQNGAAWHIPHENKLAAKSSSQLILDSYILSIAKLRYLPPSDTQIFCELNNKSEKTVTQQQEF